MRYALIVEQNVHQFVQSEDPSFPGIPLSERYSADFLKDCVECEDQTVQLGWTFDGSAFKAPPPPPEPVPEPAPVIHEPTPDQQRDLLLAQLLENQLLMRNGMHDLVKI